MNKNKVIIFLFIISIITFVIVIFSINILIKRYGTESMISQPPSQIKEQSSTEGKQVETEKALEPQEEEPEMEFPIKTEEPLLD